VKTLLRTICSVLIAILAVRMSLVVYHSNIHGGPPILTDQVMLIAFTFFACFMSIWGLWMESE